MNWQGTTMGMPLTIEIADADAADETVHEAVLYLQSVDDRFSTYKQTSEISAINRGELNPEDASFDMKEVLRLCEETKKKTNGYFDIDQDKMLDPSGLVKGWAIYNAAQIIADKGFRNFYVDIGGDVEARGKNQEAKQWSVGIQNPFNLSEIVKAIQVEDKGVATSGTYRRGRHIYDPVEQAPAGEIASITVIGPNVYEADRFATAAFAMGTKGIQFIEELEGFEGYMISHDKRGYQTSGFPEYVIPQARYA